MYFVDQQAVPQLNTPLPIQVTVTNDSGELTETIDDYSMTTQSVTATSIAIGSNSAMASEAIGGARDILVNNLAATGQLTVFVDDVSDTLSVGSLGDGVGTALIQYDGPDGTVPARPDRSRRGLPRRWPRGYFRRNEFRIGCPVAR